MQVKIISNDLVAAQRRQKEMYLQIIGTLELLHLLLRN